jgi:hypothetical protein
MNRVRSSDRPRPGRAALLALLLGASIAGCGTGTGEVRGTVRYNGKPLPFGTIQFLGADGIPHAAPIGPDGTFLLRVPAGAARVIVSCVDEARLNHFAGQLAAGRGGRVAPPRPPSGGFSLIPPRYADWNASGLTARVERGQTVQDFALVSN